MSLVDTPAWRALATHAEAVRPRHLRELFAADAERFERFSLRQDGLLLDFSKQRIDVETLALLHDLAEILLWCFAPPLAIILGHYLAVAEGGFLKLNRFLFAALCLAAADERPQLMARLPAMGESAAIGADGEARVAANLEILHRRDPRWCAIHAVPVGDRGSDIDHVVVGRQLQLVADAIQPIGDGRGRRDGGDGVSLQRGASVEGTAQGGGAGADARGGGAVAAIPGRPTAGAWGTVVLRRPRRAAGR